MNLANSFDGIDPSGKPHISPDRITISDPEERLKIEQFLNGGGFVMGTGRKAVDLLDPDRGRVVPVSYSTDGEWVWPIGIAYYLAEHGAPIETNFLNHIRSCNYSAFQPNEAQIEQAIRLLSKVDRS